MKVYNSKHTEITFPISRTIERIRQMRQFDVNLYVKAKTNILNNYMHSCGLDSCVIAVSGGIDSAVVLSLVKEASKQPNSPIKKILAVTIPSFDGSVTNQEATVLKSKILCDSLDVHLESIEITEESLILATDIENRFKQNIDPWSRGQIVSYIRTPTLYYFTTVMNSQGLKPVLVGTINRDEGAYLGYLCKSGDGCVDLQLISDIHKSEVYKIGKFLSVPDIIMESIPSGDMFDGRDDEDVFGAPYDFVELFLSFKNLNVMTVNSITSHWDESDHKQYKQYSCALEKLHSYNAHKYSGGSTALHLDVMEAGIKNGWQDGIHSTIHKKERKSQIIKTHKFVGFTDISPNLTESLLDYNTQNYENVVETKNIFSKKEIVNIKKWFELNSKESLRSNQFGRIDPGQKGSLRLSFYDEDFAKIIFERLKIAQSFNPLRIFDNKDKTNWQPYKQWRAIGLNPLFRVLKYDEGSSLNTHYDDSYYKDEIHRSLMTVIFIIQSAKKGGATRFIHDNQDSIDFKNRDFSDWNHSASIDKVKFKLSTEGSVIIFDHRELHDGELVTEGEKIIIRTDLMYEYCDFLV